jgi:hypothetical protein
MFGKYFYRKMVVKFADKKVELSCWIFQLFFFLWIVERRKLEIFCEKLQPFFLRKFSSRFCSEKLISSTKFISLLKFFRVCKSRKLLTNFLLLSKFRRQVEKVLSKFHNYFWKEKRKKKMVYNKLFLFDWNFIQIFFEKWKLVFVFFIKMIVGKF